MKLDSIEVLLVHCSAERQDIVADCQSIISYFSVIAVNIIDILIGSDVF